MTSRGLWKISCVGTTPWAAVVWVCKAEVPDGGVASAVTEADTKENLDPKRPPKK